MSNEVLVSTGALIGRPNGRDFRLLKELTPKINSDGFEFMMYSTWYGREDEIVDFLKSNDIHTPCFHCQKSIGESISKGSKEDWKDAFDKFEINVKMASEISAKKMVMHLWDGMTSDAFMENNLKAYPMLKDIADGYGVDLLIENVVCNVNDPMSHWMELLDLYPDIGFIFDTKMAAFHGQLELLYDKKYEMLWKEKHIRHYHVNDYGGGLKDWANLRTLPIGKGHIDFDRFFSFIEKIGYKGTYTLESTAFNKEGFVDTDMLNEEIAYVKNKLGMH
ncbi:MAG: sugar phosphate isomerase/epimerase [Lachnospiraceae bacterium]|nr:sugar phosphate isomerase/epimerase [Lachnospiraceae bacterium]